MREKRNKAAVWMWPAGEIDCFSGNTYFLTSCVVAVGKRTALHG